LLTLDHVIIGVADSKVSAEALGLVLGRRPSWRGRHPSYGTANVLFRLDNAYLELLAPDAEATSDTAWTGSLGRFLRERGEGLFSIALQTSDVAAATARARGKGLPVEDPLPGRGVDLDTGATREWINARIPPESTRGTRCFFIEHNSPSSALPLAGPIGDSRAAVGGIAAVVASSAEPEAARRMWREDFGLAEAPAPDGGWRFDLGNATLFLQAGPVAGEVPDRWDSLVLKVPDLASTAERLRLSGLVAATASAAGFEGLAVTSCGARVLLTEAT
jgi:hypothetical protein